MRALWLVQRYGTAEAVDPAADQRVKGVLFKALGKEGELTLAELRGLMDADTFKKLAGSDDRIDAAELRSAAAAAMPESRTRLLPKIRAYAECLTTSYDMIDEPHRLAGRKLAEWIAQNYRPGQNAACHRSSAPAIPAGACSGRRWAISPPPTTGCRSCAFHSGGTAPTAFNSRTVAALRDIGVEIEPGGQGSRRGGSRRRRTRCTASAGVRRTAVTVRRSRR